jgi:WXG100 family type VII secretion target
MSSPIAVKVADLQRAHEDFVQAISTSRARHNEMQQNVSSLGTAWTGGAAQAFGNSLNQWCEQFESVINQLEGMRAKLEEVAQGYNATHNATIDIATNAAIIPSQHTGLGI